MTHCKDFKEHFELNKFVSSTWSTPGLNILNDKCMKRKDKLQQLLKETGYFGPILDQAIRGTVSHLLVCNFEKGTKEITNLEDGYLKRFLRKHFQTSELMETIGKLFSKNPQWILDYEYSYRHKRSAIIQSQITFLTTNPQNLVRITYLPYSIFYYSHCLL